MMEKLDAIVMPLGFEVGQLVRAVVSHRYSAEVRVVLFMPTYRDERAERAYSEFERICSTIFPDGMNVERVDVDLRAFTGAVTTIRRVFEGLADKSVAICFTGGMRALCLAMFVAYLLTKWAKDPVLKMYLEGQAEVLTIPLLHSAFAPSLTKKERMILKALGPTKDLVSLSYVAHSVKRHRSTVYRQLTRLTEMGLVERVEHEYRLTDLGILLQSGAINCIKNAHP